MSWCICLIQDGEIVRVPSFLDGIIHELGYEISPSGEAFLSREEIVPSESASITVTYNLTGFFKFKDLHGKRAKDTIQVLRDAVEALGVEKDEDPYSPTPGNAGSICSLFLSWARDYPDATWEVD